MEQLSPFGIMARVDHGEASRPDLLGSCQAPLGILQLPHLRGGWQMIVYCVTPAGTNKTHVCGNRFLTSV